MVDRIQEVTNTIRHERHSRRLESCAHDFTEQIFAWNHSSFKIRESIQRDDSVWRRISDRAIPIIVRFENHVDDYDSDLGRKLVKGAVTSQQG